MSPFQPDWPTIVRPTREILQRLTRSGLISYIEISQHHTLTIPELFLSKKGLIRFSLVLEYGEEAVAQTEQEDRSV